MRRAPRALARLEESDDGAHATVVIAGLWHSQFDQDAAHVFLDGAFGDPELPSDPRIGPALRHERENLTLPRGKRVNRIVARPGCDGILHQAPAEAYSPA